MAENNPFGFDPEDLDRVVREAGEELRELKDRIFSFLEPPVAPTRTQPRPETTGEKGDGVWVVYTTEDDGVARVDQVHRTELDALRTLKGNTDPRRSVRFLLRDEREHPRSPERHRGRCRRGECHRRHRSRRRRDRRELISSSHHRGCRRRAGRVRSVVRRCGS